MRRIERSQCSGKFGYSEACDPVPNSRLIRQVPER